MFVEVRNRREERGKKGTRVEGRERDGEGGQSGERRLKGEGRNRDRQTQKLDRKSPN